MPIYRVPIAVFAILCGVGAFTYWLLQSRHAAAAPRLLRRFWAAYAAIQLTLAGIAFHTHLFFPLNLEFMESTALQHVLRLSAGLPIYVDPSPEFVALAYNPLFYVVCVPFVQLFGPNLTAIRIPAILASIAAALVLGLFVCRLTRSLWWSFVAVGVFAAAYRLMDCYLDVGHRDSFLLLAILLGYLLLHQDKPVAGLLVLGVGFWFKQTCLIYLALGICYVIWQHPRRQALVASLAGLGAGPLLHALAPGTWFGVRMHYFTFEVPSAWTEFHSDEASNLLRLLVWHYGALLLAAGWLWYRGWRKPGGKLGMLRMTIPGALVSGAAISMTPGSSNNVYIPMGALIIIGGITGLARLSRAGARGRQLAYALLAVTFAPLAYNLNQAVLPRPGAGERYAEFTRMLASLDGPVYGPGFGILYAAEGAPEVRLTPKAHVVPMADMVRGRGRDERTSPVVRTLLRSVETPASPVAYIIAHSRLEDEPTLAYLSASYRLEKDFGTRFEPLATLPSRHGHLYPRFLYKSIPVPRRDSIAHHRAGGPAGE